MDTGQLDEGVGRLDRAADGLRHAGAGLDRLPVGAVATGADALLDALADLGRQWRAGLDRALEHADALAAGLRQASAAYTEAEREAGDGARLVRLLPGLITPTPAPSLPSAALPSEPDGPGAAR